MVKHIVMWRMAESEDKEQRAKDIKENLEALKGKIDVLVNIEVGLKEDLNTYQNHPEHKAVGATYVRPYVAERRVCDYEF